MPDFANTRVNSYCWAGRGTGRPLIDPRSRVTASPVTAQPAITFAIPFYSGTRYLARAIDSIFAQRDPAWQAVVIDDGAEPGVDALVRGYGERISYVKNPHNLGLGGNFNRCLDLATTDLVTVLHADDELMPEYGATMRAAAERHPGAVAVFCRCRIIGPDDQPVFSLADLVKGRGHFGDMQKRFDLPEFAAYHFITLVAR